MAVKGKGKQIAGKAPASSPSTSSGKRKKPVSGAQEGRRKRRPGVLQFFDHAARDADYDEEEEDNGDEDDLDFDDEDLDLGIISLSILFPPNLVMGPALNG